MSRLTGTDAYGLMEAYNAVYAPQELTEEQVQEDFENWVNSLVEEGYDLSEYTWEEMYEEYLTEIGFNPAARGSTTRGAVTTYGANDTRRSQSGPVQSRFARPAPATAITTRSGTQSAPVSNLGRNYRGQELQATARANASQVRPTAPVARPAAAPAAAPRPAAAPAAAATTNTKTTPTAAPSTPATKPTNPQMSGMPSVPSMAAPAGGPKLSTRAQALKAGGPQAGAREKVLNQDLDLFDVIKGHLIDEGYADTEESALAIMANMSEEWRESIVEGMTSYERNRQRAAQRAAARNEARKQGKTGNVPGVGYVSPRPERETWTDEGGKERHKTGARMPKKEG